MVDAIAKEGLDQKDAPRDYQRFLLQPAPCAALLRLQLRADVRGSDGLSRPLQRCGATAISRRHRRSKHDGPGAHRYHGRWECLRLYEAPRVKGGCFAEFCKFFYVADLPT